MKCKVLFPGTIHKQVKMNPHAVARVAMFYLWHSLALTIRTATCCGKYLCLLMLLGNCFLNKEK